jgi:predicted nucleic acid-binding protein
VNSIFADTFYFLALVHRDDAAHLQARTLSDELTEPILTTAWVLTEVADAMAGPGLRQVFLRLLETLKADPNCTIVPPTEALFEQGVKLYSDRPDKDWSLTDCRFKIQDSRKGRTRGRKDGDSAIGD